MFLSMGDILAFFAAFERQIALEAPPGVMESERRDIVSLVKTLEGYSNSKISFQEIDFSDGLDVPEAHAHIVFPSCVASFIANFGKHAEIYVNAALNGSQERIVNHCHTRFYIIKEAMHVIIRDEFNLRESEHPDAGTPEIMMSVIEKIIYLPVSILDLTNSEYPDSIKVENYAELLAALLLYPLDLIASDRVQFLRDCGAKSFDDDEAQLASTLPYAEKVKIPQRYVDLLFRWSNFDNAYSIYKQKRDDF